MKISHWFWNCSNIHLCILDYDWFAFLHLLAYLIWIGNKGWETLTATCWCIYVSMYVCSLIRISDGWIQFRNQNFDIAASILILKKAFTHICTVVIHLNHLFIIYAFIFENSWPKICGCKAFYLFRIEALNLYLTKTYNASTYYLLLEMQT